MTMLAPVRRLRAAVLAAVAALAVAAMAFVAPARATPGEVLVVAGDAVAMRARPDSAGAVVARLKRGDRIMELERRDGWARGLLFGAIATEGWVLLRLLRPEAPPEPAGAAPESGAVAAPAPRAAAPYAGEEPLLSSARPVVRFHRPPRPSKQRPVLAPAKPPPKVQFGPPAAGPPPARPPEFRILPRRPVHPDRLRPQPPGY